MTAQEIETAVEQAARSWWAGELKIWKIEPLIEHRQYAAYSNCYCHVAWVMILSKHGRPKKMTRRALWLDRKTLEPIEETPGDRTHEGLT